MALLLAGAFVLIDQLSKLWVASSLELGASVPVGLGFSITHSRNTGAAFGMLRDVGLQLGPLTIDTTFLLGILSAVVTVWLTVFLLVNRARLTGLTSTALALVLAGAAGNMLDRFRLGYVTDFIHFKVGWFDYPIFNIADSCVVIGAVLLVLATWRSGSSERDRRGPKTKPAARGHSLVDMPEPPPLGGRDEGASS